MGRIAVLLEFFRVKRNGAFVSDVKTDPGGGANVTGQHFSSPGDDAFPLPDDYTFNSKNSGTGRDDITGYIDPEDNQRALAGDKRIYARDSSKEYVVDYWLKSDGSAILENENGNYELRADGSHKMISPGGSYELLADGAQELINENGSAKLNADGSSFLENAQGFIKLLANGDVNINGVIITKTGDTTIPTVITSPSIMTGGKQLKDHTHLSADPPANTGTNN